MSALDCDMLKLAPLFASLYVRLEIIYIVLINILIHTELLQVTEPLPDLNAVKSVQRLSWAAGVGMLHLIQSTNEEIHKAYDSKVRFYIFSLNSFLFLLNLWKENEGNSCLANKTQFLNCTRHRVLFTPKQSFEVV